MPFELEIDYWKDRLKGVKPLNLFTDYPRPNVQSINKASIELIVDEKTAKQLNLFSTQHKVTLFVTLLAAYKVLLYRYSSQEDICVGNPVLSSHDGKIESFANALALRTEINSNDNFEELLQRVNNTITDALKHQAVPFEKIVNELVDDVDLGTNPLNQVMFVLQNGHESQDESLTQYTSKSDLVFKLKENASGLQGTVEYSTDLYQEDTINRIIDHYKLLLNSIIASPKKSIGSLPILTKAEEHKLLTGLHNTAFDYPKDKSLIDLFEEQVKKAPANIAIIFEDFEITYLELNKLANQFGDYLRTTYQIKPDDLVAMKLERSEWMIIAILGILKAGGAYVPIDPDYPEERISFMMSDSASKVLVDNAEIEKFKKSQSKYSQDNPSTGLRGDHLVYCIYTSGSTGNPKGVLVEHRNVSNLILSQKQVYKITEDERVLQFSTITFDPSAEQIWIAFLTGAALVVISKATLVDIRALENYIIEKKVTHIHTVPAYLAELSIKDMSNVKRVITGGESCTPVLAERWKSICTFINEYGPTETTITSVEYVAASSDNYHVFVPIGRPTANTDIYILDDYQRLLPYGALGEICIGGDGITRGYLNRPELTKEKFIENPYKPGERIYRTGDLGRWLPDGNLEYLGRIDDQVKIRGYRIELDEIITVLQKHEKVNAAVVIARAIKGQEKELIAYTTGEAEAIELRNYLKEQLPSYMVPGYFVHLDSIPLTNNGKVDKKILPMPDGNDGNESVYIPPSTDTEKVLVKLWADVLGMPEETISIKSDFFDMGGHSIKAIRLRGLIHKELGIKLPLKELFSESTIQMQAESIDIKDLRKYQNIEVVEEQDDYELSAAQRRLWIINHFEGAQSAYNIPYVIFLEGRLDKTALKNAFRDMAYRHEILRTVFKEDKTGTPRQYIISKDAYTFKLNETDLRKTADQQTILDQLVDKEISKNFNLNTGPLLRAHLVQLKEDKHLLVMVHHHIVSDGWSTDVFRKEWCALYNAHSEGKEPQLPLLKLQYKDYAAWHTRQLESSDDIMPHKEYWIKQFEGEIPILELPADKERPGVKTFNGARLTATINNDVLDKLNKTGKMLGGTLFMNLLACVNVLLYRYTGQEDIIIGSPTMGREHPDLEQQIGFYINTLALRTRFNGNESYNNLFENIKEVTLGAYEHQLYPYDELVESLRLPPNINRNPLFDVMVILQNAMEQDADFTLNGLQTSIYEGGEYKAAKFDINFIFSESKRGLDLFLEYNTDIYSEAQMERMLNHFENIISAVVSNPKQSLASIDLLTDEEKHQLLNEFNDTTPGYTGDKTVIGLFEDQVKQNPDKAILAFGETELNYRELNEKSNQLAHYLKTTYGIQGDDLVGLMLDRSEWMVISILGVLKAGGAYVPIDPDYPEDRIGYMLEDSKCKVLITKDELEKFKQQQSNYSKDNLPTKSTLSNLAYVIYTSGSTGKPKGVMVEHGNLVRFTQNLTERYGFRTGMSLAALTTYTFDISVLELLSTISTGIYVRVMDEIDPVQILSQLKEYKINILQLTPSRLNQLTSASLSLEPLSGLDIMLIGGEALPERMYNDLRKELPKVSVINVYGPTEATIWSTSLAIHDSNRLTIGKPLIEEYVYILNELGQLLPIGVPGELHIAGTGVTRGYLNRPELTSEKFVADPFRPGERMYKTGDIGRWLPDGNIECLGRVDDQVKIRGYRIELDEISAVLQKHDKVKDAVVVARVLNGPEKELIAYTTGTAEAIELRSFLKEYLPVYMVPAYYVHLETIPLTSNGKINRKVLPLPESSGIEPTEYVAPSTDIEKKLAKIWAEVLGIPAKTISIKSDFFDLGGHSIRAIRLLGLIHKELGVKLPLKELFSDSTIEQQGASIANRELREYETIEIVKEQADYKLSSAQRRLWILNHFEGAQNAYNIPYVILLEGKLNKTALKDAFQDMASRHEILRTVFREDNTSTPRQYIISKDAYVFQLKETDLRNSADQKSALDQLVDQESFDGFDFIEGPLWRCHLVQLEEEKHVLMMVHHHIISDGWSMDIFRKEWCTLYNSRTEGKEPQLPLLRIQYKDYAAWHTRQLESTADIAPHKEYWIKQFEGEIPILELPADKERPGIKTFNGASLTATISNGVLDNLNKTGKTLGGTLFMNLLACINVLLYRYTNQEDIVIGSPTAGREHPDLEDQIGFYINTLALRTRFNGADSYNSLFQNIKEVTLGAYEHQLYPYDELVDSLKLPRNINRNPLFDVMVVLQNAMEQDAEFTLNGLQTSIYEGGEYRVAKFDINFIFSESKRGLDLFLEYNTDIYSTGQMKRMLKHFENIIAEVVRDPNQILSEIDILTSEERHRLLYEFNDTIVEYPKEKTLADIFEEQVVETPDAVALRQHEQTMTYSELNARANQLARHLIANGVNKGDNVGLLVTRSFNMIIGMFGILKAGGAYVPIDPEYPIDRQEYILENSVVTKVVTDGDYPLEKLVPADLFVKLKTLDLSTYENTNPGLKVDSTQLAYTIYTSGSTGRPKGVMIEHHMAVNLVLWVNTEYNIGVDDRLLFITSMCFDLSVYDIFGMLSAGGSLVIVEQQELMDVPKLKDMMIKDKITFWDSVPTTMDYLVRELEAHDTGYLQNTLKVVFMSGDWIPVNLPDRIKKYFPNTQVISLGGATEGTVWSNFYPVKKVESNWGSIPYGRPMNNNFFYILNEKLQPAPIGVVGELYIGGVGVARGYANEKEKTDYAFVKDPFNDRAGGRMYRTGDLGRMMPDLNMEFIGRKDNQVKIRGYRIELGEIESVLRQCELVSQAVVLAVADKDRKKRLVGYVVGKGNYDRANVIIFLKSKLPDYMVPTLWVELDSIPLTSNGKIDRKALPEFNAEEQIKEQYIAPRTDSEKLLVVIWEDVLKVNNVGITHDFFDLGGHSLLAVQIVNQIKKKTGKVLPISILFKYSNIELLDAFLNGEETEREDKALIPIKPTGSKMPMYFVHGVGLNVMNFADVASALDEDQPLYGLQALGLGGKFHPMTDLSEIAKTYVSEIIEHNPTGPYAIGGYSLGGFIALEMRRQFELMNKEVKVLAIIDTNADHTDDFITLLPKKLKRHSMKWLKLLLNFATQPGKTIQAQKSIKMEDKAYRYDAIKIAKESGDKDYYNLMKNIRDNYYSAFRKSKIAPFNGFVYLFRAATCIHYTNDKQYLGWSKYALKGVKEIELPGDHRTMLLKPNADQFARALQAVLDDHK